MAERIIGESIVVNCVESNDGCDCGEGADEEDANQGYLLPRYSVDADERLDGQSEDEDIGQNVKGRGDCRQLADDSFFRLRRSGDDLQ